MSKKTSFEVQADMRVETVDTDFEEKPAASSAQQRKSQHSYYEKYKNMRRERVNH